MDSNPFFFYWFSVMVFCKPSPGRAPAHGPEFPEFTSTPIFLQKRQIFPTLANFPRIVKYLQVGL